MGLIQKCTEDLGVLLPGLTADEKFPSLFFNETGKRYARYINREEAVRNRTEPKLKTKGLNYMELKHSKELAPARNQ